MDTTQTSPKAKDKKVEQAAPAQNQAPAQSEPKELSEVELKAQADAIALQQKAIADKKEAQDKKVADLRAQIANAVRRRNMVIALPSDSEEEKAMKAEFAEFQQAKSPTAYESMLTLPDELEADLKDMLLANLSPREKELRLQYDTEFKALNDATAKFNETKALITAEFPNFFGDAPKKKSVSVTATTGDTPANGKPLFPTPATGWRTPEEDVKLMKDIITSVPADQVISETDVLAELYNVDRSVYNIQGVKNHSHSHYIKAMKELGKWTGK